MKLKQAPNSKPDSPLILGIDIGTSGIRAVLVTTKHRNPIAEFSVNMALPKRQGTFSEQAPNIWIDTLNQLLLQIQHAGLTANVQHIILDATSSSVCLVDEQGNALTQALMYDDKRAQAEAVKIQTLADQNSAAHGASSTLAKVMWLQKTLNKPAFICHQIDYVLHYFSGAQQLTDLNNALKLGFDPVTLAWPKWIEACLSNTLLPKIVQPGDFIGQIQPGLVEKYGFSASTRLYAGTTDSIAAFLASGASELGDAVTSLGSTITLKLLTDRPIFAPEFGIYSHRLGNKWLIGGASNTGGAVILKYFEMPDLLKQLKEINPTQSTGLNYYPLMSQGERFPIADATLMPKLTPKAQSSEKFLLGMIEGLVEIERLGYQRLNELGAYPIQRIFTAGGGTKNPIWMHLRKKSLNAPLVESRHSDAAYGVTQLIKLA